MSDFYDSLETRDPEEREQDLFNALTRQLANAREYAPLFNSRLEGVDLSGVTSREALARLPVTRKSEIAELQRESSPFGGLAATPVSDLLRVFASPGGVYEPESRREDYWRMARALFAAGFRRGDLVHNTFSYHFSPAASMMETGAHALGCPVFPAGVGQTELQVEAIAHLRPSRYAGTPSFLRIILDKAREMSLDVSSITRAMVGAEPFPPAVRAEFAEQGVTALQCYATADLGLIGYESEAAEGLIIDEHLIVEILTPGTGDPVADGDVGEVVVTTLNEDYPLIRFATGDLSAVLPGPSPCGRTAMRIKGWMGRADQTAKVRGLFVKPSMVVEVAKRHPELGRTRLVLTNPDHKDAMTLHCESESMDDAMKSAIVDSIRDVTKLRAEVKRVAPGSLPNDGKVIDDTRSFD